MLLRGNKNEKELAAKVDGLWYYGVSGTGESDQLALEFLEPRGGSSATNLGRVGRAIAAIQGEQFGFFVFFAEGRAVSVFGGVSNPASLLDMKSLKTEEYSSEGWKGKWRLTGATTDNPYVITVAVTKSSDTAARDVSLRFSFIDNKQLQIHVGEAPNATVLLHRVEVTFMDKEKDK